MLLSIVVPCYNEEESVHELIKRVTAMAEKSTIEHYELILIDDGSRDKTWPIIREASTKNSSIVAVKLSRNHGHQLALTAGLSLVQGDLVLVIDADLQDPPELFDDMRSLLEEENADVVYGQRKERLDESFFKKISASFFYRFLSKNTKVNIPLDTGDFRLMTRRISDLLVQMPEKDRFIRGMVSWLGFKQVPFEYERDARFAGETKYPLRKMLRLAADAFMGFSMLPLRFAGMAAGMLLLIMLGFTGYALFSWIYLDTIKGWTSMIILISFVSAIQMAMLSVISEYIGRIYLESKMRPLFIIDKVERSGA